MKPKTFIGSSTEAIHIAEAIHAELQKDVECTVWTHGVFKLSHNYLQDLMHLVSDSDFGIFVFSPDDTAEMRGKLFSIPRDNVVYELGLFSGALGTNRCFFVTPLGNDLHILSDLLGITSGDYEPIRSDKNWQAAVGPFCAKVRQIIGELGLRDFVGQGLRDLVIQYECCDWIDDLDQRVAKRRVIYEQMASFCHRNDVNKRKLLRWLRVGSSVALAAAILAKPTKDDDELILAIDAKALPKGFAQHAMLASILNLDKRGKIASSRRKSIIDWAEKMSDPDSTIKKGIAEFKSAGV